MLRDKNIVWLLLSYMLFQLTTLFLGGVLFLFVYLIAYLAAIIYTTIKTSKNIIQTGSLKSLIQPLALFFLANLVLFLIYIPSLMYNKDINWKLKGDAEVDPMLFQAYVPPIFFMIALIVIILAALFTKVVANYKRRLPATEDIN